MNIPIFQLSYIYKPTWPFQSPDYNWPTADIALLETTATMGGTENTAIVTFAPDDGHQYVDDECWVAGWGTSSINLWKNELSFYRSQTKFGVRLCFYTCLSVILFTGGRRMFPLQRPSPPPWTETQPLRTEIPLQ